MITPERGIKRIRIAAASLTLGALAAVGITSGLAYADSTSAKTTVTDTSSTTTSGTTTSGTGTDTGTTGSSTSTGTSDGSSSTSDGTTFGTSPTVTTGSGDSHAQTSGS